jgi:uncharacterized delta-60 repeat protein
LVVATDGAATIGGSISIYQTPPLPDSGNGGDAVVRLTPNGTLDPTFDGDGIWIEPPYDFGFNDLEVDPSGRVIVSNYVFNYFGGYRPGTIYRLNADGSPDETFGSDGAFVLPRKLGNPFKPFGNPFLLTAAAVQSDGKILLVGTNTGKNSETVSAEVVRIDPDDPFQPDPRTPVAVSGDGGTVKIFRPDDSGQLTFDDEATPFPGYTSAVRVATADLTGDGIDDYVYATGPGRADLRLVDGATGDDLLTHTAFTPYEASFTGELFVAAGDIDGDLVPELVVSPDVGGGARVQIFSFADGVLQQKDNFFAIDDPAFRGGCRVAVGDMDGDGTLDLAVGAGTGGGPRIALYDGKGLSQMQAAPVKLVGDFLAFPDAENLHGGVFVAAGDIDDDRIVELAVAPGDGGGPRVRLLHLNGEPVADFFSDDPTLRGGAHLAVNDIDGNFNADLVVGSGARVAAKLQVYLGSFLSPLGDPDQTFDPFSRTLPGGVFVG